TRIRRSAMRPSSLSSTSSDRYRNKSSTVLPVAKILYAYCRLGSVKPQWIMLFVGSNDGVKVWHNGKPIWENQTERRALRYDDMVMLHLGPGSNDLLFRVHNEAGDSGLFINYKALDHVVPTLPEKLDMSILAERLKGTDANAKQTDIPAHFLDVDWTQAVARGKLDRGEKLFEKLGCVKCHTAKMNEAGGVGPSLAEAGMRFTIPQLVQSILLPSQQVSPVFRATSIVTENGKVLSGLVVGETAEKLEMVLSDTHRATILKGNIADRVLQDISPMPLNLVATPDELRDLLAFLLNTDYP
ncbi:MAG: c-type cytochrome, partial [Pirellulaceae bacterium]